MCVIAGYTGNKPAAPILIEMLQKMQYFDGGYATGIATIHEGKLYYAKAKGDVSMLLQMTDALNLPGTTGIIHSRPGFDFFSTTHPYIDADEKLALVANGTFHGTGTPELFAELRAVMDELLDEGVHSRFGNDMTPTGFYEKFQTKDGRAFYVTETLAYAAGHAVAKAAPADKRRAHAEGVCNIHQRVPFDHVSVSIHADVPDSIVACTLTRPMSVLEAEGECYLASCAIAFPENVKGKITHLPQTAVHRVTPCGLEVVYDHIDGVKVEPVTEEILEAYADYYTPFLSNGKEGAKSFYEIPVPWHLWHEPRVDCRYVKEGDYYKAHMPALYQLFYRWHKQGRLRFYTGIVYARDVSWPNVDVYFTKFYLAD